MTEAEWLAQADPVPMIHFLRENYPPGHGRRRKLRLFAVACCQRILHLACPPRTLQILERAIDVAEGQAQVPHRPRDARGPRDAPYACILRSASQAALQAATLCAQRVRDATYFDMLAGRPGPNMDALNNEENENKTEFLLWSERQRQEAAEEALRLEARIQADLVRDLFGNPFQEIPINREWLLWNDGCVRHLAEGIEREQNYSEMPILADALLDAGCAEETLMDHCRSHGTHVRGCWVVDRLLSRELPPRR